MICSNCGAKLSCGCQKRVAANGRQCCANCIASCNQSAGAPPSTPLPKQATPNRPYVTPRGPYTPHP